MATASGFGGSVRLSALCDLATLIGAIVVLGSLFMAWYRYGLTLPTGGSPFLGLSIGALGRFAGGWRYLILALAVAAVLEILASWALKRTRSSLPWPHRQLMLTLSVALLVLVIAGFVANPLSAGPQEQINNVTIVQASHGAGAFVALAGALSAVAAAVARALAEPSTLRR